ncbi:glycosyltransferase [Trichothermofontia sp.]
MRKLYFLLPGTGPQFACGGLWAELKVYHLACQLGEAAIVTYRQREKDTLFLDDVLREKNLDEGIFVLSWGFDVPKLAARLRRYPLIYHAHSAGYGFRLPSRIPIITVSRHTMGYWGQRSPHALIYYLPNQIADEFTNLGLERDIDVLVQARKSSTYLLKKLIPALQSVCRVEVVNTYVENLPQLFNRAKVYLYDSAEYWAQQGVTEGFGLQPLEAMACGCHVFSSVNHGLSDYFDPGFNGEKIAGYSLTYDRHRILTAIAHYPQFVLSEPVFAEYREPNIRDRLTRILTEINNFFDYPLTQQTPIRDFSQVDFLIRKSQKVWQKICRKLSV